MAPLSGDLIKLLRSTDQVVEPNLEDLAEEFASGSFVMDMEDVEAEGGVGNSED